MEKNLFFTILTGCSCVFGVENAVEVTNLREFFYADYLISEHKNLDFRVHSPIEQAAFPAIRLPLFRNGEIKNSVNCRLENSVCACGLKSAIFTVYHLNKELR